MQILIYYHCHTQPPNDNLQRSRDARFACNASFHNFAVKSLSKAPEKMSIACRKCLYLMPTMWLSKWPLLHWYSCSKAEAPALAAWTLWAGGKSDHLKWVVELATMRRPMQLVFHYMSPPWILISLDCSPSLLKWNANFPGPNGERKVLRSSLNLLSRNTGCSSFWKSKEQLAVFTFFSK